MSVTWVVKEHKVTSNEPKLLLETHTGCEQECPFDRATRQARCSGRSDVGDEPGTKETANVLS